MKNVLLTGSSGGIGQQIARRLSSAGYTILPVESRLEDVQSLVPEIQSILSTRDIHVLINCAGFGVFRPHEEIPVEMIQTMVNVNLVAPMILCKLCLPGLKATKGHIINISSVEATRHSRFSALYTATKSGLRDFSLSLFEELRKSGVRVSSINPDITKTGFFDHLPFGPAEDELCYLDPSELALMVQTVLETRGVVTDLTIRPQKVGIDKRSR